MDSPTHLLLIPLALSWDFLFYPSSSPTYAAAPHHGAPSKLVQEVCTKTSNYSFCIEAYESDPRTPSASTLLHLARIAIELGKANATDTRYHIADMYRSNETEAAKKPSLEWCIFWYDEVVTSFSCAEEELEEDLLSANYDVFIAGESAGQCEGRLASDRVQDTWISRRNNFTKYFSDIAFVTTTG